MIWSIDHGKNSNDKDKFLYLFDSFRRIKYSVILKTSEKNWGLTNTDTRVVVNTRHDVYENKLANMALRDFRYRSPRSVDFVWYSYAWIYEMYWEGLRTFVTIKNQIDWKNNLQIFRFDVRIGKLSWKSSWITSVNIFFLVSRLLYMRGLHLRDTCCHRSCREYY